MLAVIMAGGHGTRLWPLSTTARPKQFQKLLSNKTMLQETYHRLDFLDPDKIFVSTNQEYAHLVREQLPELPDENIIIEPLRRDTGPAMAFVAHYLAELGHADQVMSIVYADHHIKEVDQFQARLQSAQKIAQDTKKITIVQVKAKEPNTSLGYVKIGAEFPSNDNEKVYHLDQFIEKPDFPTAVQYANSLDYLWNTGLYTWHIASFLKLIENHAPEINEILAEINEHKNCTPAYHRFPKISIDYALMEKLSGEDVLILPAEFTWSDVGSWETIHKELCPEPGANVLSGAVVTKDSNNCIIYANTEQEIVALGVNDLAIIATDDKILICPKSEANKLKQLTEEI